MECMGLFCESGNQIPTPIYSEPFNPICSLDRSMEKVNILWLTRVNNSTQPNIFEPGVRRGADNPTLEKTLITTSEEAIADL
jgi:hypothetical protein